MFQPPDSRFRIFVEDILIVKSKNVCKFKAVNRKNEKFALRGAWIVLIIVKIGRSRNSFSRLFKNSKITDLYTLKP